MLSNVTKPFVKFCTPYFNEWKCDTAYIDADGFGHGTPLHNANPLPIEVFFDELAQRAGYERYEAGMIVELPEFKFKWERVRGTYIGRSRDALVNGGKSRKVKQEPQPGYTDFFMIDADITPVFDTVVSFIYDDAPIISGAYQERTHKDCFCAGMQSDNTLTFIPMTFTGRHLVDWTGSGFVRVKRRVFEEVPYRWYGCIEYTYIDENGDECVAGFEEDVSFCLKARQYGFQTILDCDARVAHNITQNDPGGKRMENAKQEQQQPRMTVEGWYVGMQEIMTGINGAVSDLAKGIAAIVRNFKALDETAANLQKEQVYLKEKITSLEKQLGANVSSSDEIASIVDEPAPTKRRKR